MEAIRPVFTVLAGLRRSAAATEGNHRHGRQHKPSKPTLTRGRGKGQGIKQLLMAGCRHGFSPWLGSWLVSVEQVLRDHCDDARHDRCAKVGSPSLGARVLRWRCGEVPLSPEQGEGGSDCSDAESPSSPARHCTPSRCDHGDTDEDDRKPGRAGVACQRYHSQRCEREEDQHRKVVTQPSRLIVGQFWARTVRSHSGRP